jgi:hypothetical protein
MKEKSKESTAMIVLVVVIFLAALFNLIFLHKSYKENIKHYKGRAKGVVLTIERKYPNLAIETYGTYCFTVDTLLIENYEKLGVELNFRPFLKEGDSVDVRYNLQSPRNSTAISDDEFYPSYIIESFIVLLLLPSLIKRFIQLFEMLYSSR